MGSYSTKRELVYILWIPVDSCIEGRCDILGGCLPCRWVWQMKQMKLLLQIGWNPDNSQEHFGFSGTLVLSGTLLVSGMMLLWTG